MARKIKQHEYEAYRYWYRDARQVIKEKYGNDSDLFAGLLAATSPRNQIKRNWRLAKQLYQSYKYGKLNFYGIMQKHKPNIYRALNGEPLSGSKVESFRQNLIGNDNAVTIDVWMLRWLNDDRVSLTPKQYKPLADKIKRRAKYHRLKPSEYQAVCWMCERSDKGFRPKSFAGMFAADDAQMTFNFGD